MDNKTVRKLIKNEVRRIQKGIGLLNPELTVELKDLVDSLSKAVYVRLKEQYLKRPQ